MTNHWLMKSEPHVYSWDNLNDDGSTHWDGVRNYQARNIMREKIKSETASKKIELVLARRNK